MASEYKPSLLQFGRPLDLYSECVCARACMKSLLLDRLQRKEKVCVCVSQCMVTVVWQTKLAYVRTGT